MTQIPIHEPTLWADDGWTAQVIKNEDDDGWAVAMIKDGEPEPALVGPWTMGRDKRNPKPLDSQAFITLVKTATEYVRRHEQQRHAQLHQSIEISRDTGGPFASRSASVVVSLDIVPDDDNPHGQLSARDSAGELLAQVRVAPSFKLTRASATAWGAQAIQPARRAMIRARQATVVANRDHGNSRVVNCSKVRCRKKRFLRATQTAWRPTG